MPDSASLANSASALRRNGVLVFKGQRHQLLLLLLLLLLAVAVAVVAVAVV